MSWAEPAVQGYRDVGQPAHDGGSYSSGTVEGTAAPTPAWSVPWCRRAWLARLRAPGQGLDPVAVVVNQPFIVQVKLGGQIPSDCLSAGQLRYTVPVPPDSSSTLSPGCCVTSTSNPARQRQVL